MSKYTIPETMKVEYFLSDHLGSTSMTTDSTGAKVSEMRYKPWGEVRYSWTNDTLNANPAYALTRYTFTGQYSHMDDPSTPASEGFGLMHYGARMYDPALGRFTSADTIVPGGVQGYDRYAYVNNSPVRYTDPTGHIGCDEDLNGKCISYGYKDKGSFQNAAQTLNIYVEQDCTQILSCVSLKSKVARFLTIPSAVTNCAFSKKGESAICNRGYYRQSEISSLHICLVYLTR
ncbi:MAG: RHS repeat-associated core domain-containing protein [Chloroflexi bacterium]|nr:RHS repeat-associated core domain-containing protein [Chloroflexota bacterium]